LVVVLAVGALWPGSVGAQTPAPTATLTCEYEVSAVPIAGGAHVTVEGFAPPGRTVRAFFDPATPPVNPAPIGPAVQAREGDGYFNIQFDIFETGEVTAGVDGYPPVTCVTVPGVASGNVNRGNIVVRGLPRTGSSSTFTYVWVGLAALAVGSVLVVGARRMAHVRGRNAA
jgi:LPXTG-motif cell wall-anchored protein